MNSAATVSNMIVNWKQMDLTRGEIVWLIAEACLGWPYVWGSLGELDTPEKREYYMNRSSIGPKDAEMIRKRCQVLNGTAALCSGCKYYPNGAKTRMFDCRGFTRWTLSQVGITLNGAGATSQWNDNSNWEEKGEIKDMPDDVVCCVFKHIKSTGKMDHTGLATKDQIIHCSVEVKRGKITDSGWTHYAVPRRIREKVAPLPDTKPTLRRGSKGEYVTLLQTMLIQRDYDVGKSGADGIYGAATEAAVKLYQADHGLKNDGITGPATWASLESGQTELYTVTIQHVSKTIAEEIIRKYGGEKKKEER